MKSVESPSALVVDDQPRIRAVIVALLASLGISAIETDGKEAFGTYTDLQWNLRVVILDVQMPFVDGYEVFKLIRTVAPKQPIVFNTSCTECEIRAHVNWDERTFHLRKPFGLGDLKECLEFAEAI